MAFTVVTILGQWEDADGNPAAGTLCATPSAAMSNDGTDQTTDPVCGVLDETGTLVNRDGEPFTINATQDADTSPTEAFYTFTLKLYGEDIIEFDAFVPASSPQTFDMLQEDAI